MAAAASVARAQGFDIGDPVVVGDGSNAVVHLRPLPVVARVMTGTVVLHDDPRTWLTRELAFGHHLAANGGPAVPPASGVHPGPHQVDGLWLSLWAFAKIAEGTVTARDAGVALRALHDALAGYDGPLTPRAAIGDEIERLLALLPARNAAPHRAEHDRLRGVIAAAEQPEQALHGDASFANLLLTADGSRWTDLEEICRGWIGWDVALLATDARRRWGDAGAAQVLAGYDASLSMDDLAGVLAVDALYGALWRATACCRG